MRDYDDITEFLGQKGPYFWTSFFLLNLMFINVGYGTMYIVFVGASSAHQCQIPENVNLTEAWRSASIPAEMVNGKIQYSSCKRYSLNEISKLSALNSSPVDINLTHIPQEGCVDGWTYDRSTFYSTIITEWDLVCDNEWKVPFTTSTYFIGILCGSVTSGQFSDRFGRKPVLFITLAAHFVFLLIHSFSPSWEFFCLVFFCVGICQTSVNVTAFVLGTETLSKWMQGLFAALGAFLHYCIGYMLLPAIAFGFRDWRTLLFVLACLTILHVPLWWLISESPRWLLSQGRVKEFEDILRYAADKNGVSLPDPIFKESELERFISYNEKKHTIIDVLKGRNIRVITIMCLLLWLAANLGYFGISLNTSNLSGDPYLNCFLSAAVEVPAYFTAVVIIKRCPRRPVISTFFCIGGGLLFFIQLIPENLTELAIFLELFGKFCFTMSFCVLYMYTAEVYPTVLRNSGVGICSSTSRIGSIMAPYVLYLGKWNPFLPYIILGSLTLGCCSVNLFLPETFNRTLPETLEQMQKFRGFNKCTKVEGREEHDQSITTELPQEVTLRECTF
ncbi:solute carrier family 22 member 4-like [Conger conger]|uniref:solute carrier family 22 member 4-like n=1 Tax=Conger conger TaxID=82655 RepID=UPI002A59EE33|nr:solute carrier family 22 member 4-like [Conger conger]